MKKWEIYRILLAAGLCLASCGAEGPDGMQQPETAKPLKQPQMRLRQQKTTRHFHSRV